MEGVSEVKGYITKEQALAAMEQVTQPECFIEDTRKNFARIIEELPAADVASVVHGRWVYEDVGYICSNCGTDAPTEGDYRQVRSNHCPCCGAIMDGEEG